MAYRLGNVLYGLGCLFAAFNVGVMLYSLTLPLPPSGDRTFGIIAFMAIAGIAWGTGRALKYLCHGR